MKVDHARAIRDARYAAKKRAKISAAATARRVLEVIAVHDRNRACCRREAWPTTLAKLVAPAIAAASSRGSGDVAALLAEHQPEIIIAGSGRRR